MFRRINTIVLAIAPTWSYMVNVLRVRSNDHRCLWATAVRRVYISVQYRKRPPSVRVVPLRIPLSMKHCSPVFLSATLLTSLLSPITGVSRPVRVTSAPL
ncbi:hypothetical protein DFP73DRAFT_554583 [Morchella snyderi]|nr:hypothetical protein DFP73DRAFT_554583 [Morchella snyderi]